MNFQEYETEQKATAMYPEQESVTYTALGLAGEAGEYANKVKKILRGDKGADDRAALLSELGDVLWYVSAAAHEIGFSLEDVAMNNVEKIRRRYKAKTIRGAGDER